MSQLEVVSVNVSREKGTPKRPVEKIDIDDHGIVGDAHAGGWHRQVSLLGRQSIERFVEQTGRQVLPGEFAENITIDGLETSAVAVLDRLRLGDVELEISQIGKECHGEGCTIFQQVGKCVMPSEGIFARVVRGGTLAAGVRGEFLPRPLRVKVVTLSDRASAGEYADRSGPRIRELLESFFANRRWHLVIDCMILPDDPERLQHTLLTARQAGIDVIITTGGTGVGPRDATPEVVLAVCEKLLPGIVEHIRGKFGAENPNALLSRSVAGVAGTTQIYAIPGSVRAVEQYMGEILKTLEHLIFMLHGLDMH